MTTTEQLLKEAVELLKYSKGSNLGQAIAHERLIEKINTHLSQPPTPKGMSFEECVVKAGIEQGWNEEPGSISGLLVKTIMTSTIGERAAQLYLESNREQR